MKKVLIGALVGAVIFFALQTLLWMGGIHKDLWLYTPQQDAMLEQMSSAGLKDGLYYLPGVDPASPDVKKATKELHEKQVGKPWAMLFYHTSMSGPTPVYIIKGFLFSFIAALLACMVIWHGRFASFGSRFWVGVAFGLFTLCQGVMDEMNWWSYPWSFIKPQVIDLTLVWAITSLWFAWYLKRTD